MEQMYVWAAVGAIVAGFVQGLSGFAFGMVAMSFWVWTLEPRLAAALTVFGALTGQIIAALSVRRGFDWKLLAPFVLGGLAGVPLGVAVLPHLSIHWFKLLLGTLLVIWCPCMLFAGKLPRWNVGGRLGDALAGMVGGAMGGIGGMTGAVPTLWCTLKGFDKDAQRAVIQNFNLSMLLVTMGTYLTTGIVTRDMLPFFAIVAPAMLVPTLLGAKLYVRLSEARFRQTVLLLLTTSGVALMASALPHFLGVPILGPG